MSIMPTKSLAPQQERSRQTLACLLAATIEVLDRHGLEATTVPRIAEAANVAPASVYRRFADKDALVREAILTTLQSSSVVVKQSFAKAKFQDRTIQDASRSIVKLVFRQYREHPKLLAAIKRFVDDDADREFEKALNVIFSDNFRAMATALCSCKGLGKVKDKEKRIHFGLMTIVTAIEVMILDASSLWNVLWKESDEKVQARLVEMFLTYVGVK